MRLLALLTLLSTTLPAQVGEVRRPSTLVAGRVVDSAGKPLPNATVILSTGTIGGPTSLTRTAPNGRFVFSAIPNRSYQLYFVAGGFVARTLGIQATTRRSNLPDVVMQPGSTPLSPAIALAVERTRIPDDLLTLVRKDLGDCLAPDEAVEPRVGMTWLTLGANGTQSLMIEGNGPCLAGANNGTILIYSQFGKAWRRIFEAIGQRLEAKDTRTHGFLDLILWQHNSAASSNELTCQFDGQVYHATACFEVRYEDFDDGTPNPTPSRTECDAR